MSAQGRGPLSIFFVLLLASASVAQTPSSSPQVLVKEIAVQGNRRVQEAVILGRVSAKVRVTALRSTALGALRCGRHCEIRQACCCPE